MKRLSASQLAFGLAPVIAWLLFVALRSPDTAYLAELESARLRGEFFVMSGAPYTHLAERSLNTWSTFHGGERAAVKVLEVATLPGLTAGCIATVPLSLLGSSFLTVQQESWLRFFFVIAFSFLQWAAVSIPLRALFRRRHTKGV